MGIGENIRKFRKDKELTQEQIADMLGVSTPAVNKWENGGPIRREVCQMLHAAIISEGCIGVVTDIKLKPYLTYLKKKLQKITS